MPKVLIADELSDDAADICASAVSRLMSPPGLSPEELIARIADYDGLGRALGDQGDCGGDRARART